MWYYHNEFVVGYVNMMTTISIRVVPEYSKTWGIENNNDRDPLIICDKMVESPPNIYFAIRIYKYFLWTEYDRNLIDWKPTQKSVTKIEFERNNSIYNILHL